MNFFCISDKISCHAAVRRQLALPQGPHRGIRLFLQARRKRECLVLNRLLRAKYRCFSTLFEGAIGVFQIFGVFLGKSASAPFKRGRRLEHTESIEALFRNFADRHNLTIERVLEPNVELLLRIPRQPGLSFDLTLCAQNEDEINIGFEGFWSYFFPFEKVSQIVSGTLDDLVTGDCRLAIHTQFGRATKRVLERRTTTDWQPIHTQKLGFGVPFINAQVSYVYNQDAKPAALA